MLRLFATARLDAAAHTALADMQHAWSQQLPDPAGLRLLPTDSLHLTLRYFGPTHSERLPDLHAALAASAAHHQPCTTTLSRIEYWPAHAPRIIVATGDMPAPLAALAWDLEARTRQLGYAAEQRPFRAHVTLARARGQRLPDVLLRPPAVDLELRVVELMQSELAASGARYRTLASFPLAGTPIGMRGTDP